MATSPTEPGGAESLEAHRVALTGHCYRMLGSVVDADDAVQETMIRAWRSLSRFDGRASLRTWLTKIATNVCLDALTSEKRRARPIEEGPAGTIFDELVALPGGHWLEPVPDARALDDGEPSRRALLRESIRLAFVAALQHLPPKQRAVLLLSDVVECSASEIAELLDLSVASVNSALQRARATLRERGVDLASYEGATDERSADLLSRFVEAFERYDVDSLTALCREDVAFSMPPYSLWLSGREAVGGWLSGRGCGCRGSRIIPVSANGTFGFAQYRRAAEVEGYAGPGHRAWGIGVLEVEGGLVARWTTFLDVESLFPRFGLPLDLPA
ncbi:MAG: sigma-70 family RNA polymerase sigma factor [Myxococcales bacterium]|nr:sigma-70 family RNA polymerase sigma factor [Myxococcales bacterium]